jgi:hypothetical protein
MGWGGGGGMRQRAGTPPSASTDPPAQRKVPARAARAHLWGGPPHAPHVAQREARDERAAIKEKEAGHGLDAVHARDIAGGGEWAAGRRAGRACRGWAAGGRCTAAGAACNGRLPLLAATRAARRRTLAGRGLKLKAEPRGRAAARRAGATRAPGAPPPGRGPGRAARPGTGRCGPHPPDCSGLAWRNCGHSRCRAWPAPRPAREPSNPGPPPMPPPAARSALRPTWQSRTRSRCRAWQTPHGRARGSPDEVPVRRGAGAGAGLRQTSGRLEERPQARAAPGASAGRGSSFSLQSADSPGRPPQRAAAPAAVCAHSSTDPAPH